jgi:hypothetical protein
MVQTFAQAWGIKPKPPMISLVTPKSPEPVLQPKIVEAKAPPKAVESKDTEKSKEKSAEVRIVEKIVEVPRIIEKIVEKPREGEYVSLQYHNQLLYVLFIMHITSLIALLLVIFLKK